MPASMVIARTLACQARVRQADRRDAVLLVQIEAHKTLRRILFPVRKPRKSEQTRTLDLAILSTYGEGLPACANATSHPFTAGSQVGLHVRSSVLPFGTPPFQTLLGIGQRLKDPLGRSLDYDFLDDCVACIGRIHRFFVSLNLLIISNLQLQSVDNVGRFIIK